ncbi:hypothetical protein Sste5346_005976 [Sporothrix stenoceras]|uniref:Alpha/beta hydrolase fold-3 domain-containing protein n=1 Tax=Sporothrix stenoceras TaxID=5173 RepID=A0ABR3Z0N5_9PEZI
MSTTTTTTTTETNTVAVMPGEDVLKAILGTNDNIINALDRNYVESFMKLTLSPGPSDPLDVAGARKWLEDQYGPMPKTPQAKRVRPEIELAVEDVPIVYGEDKATFNIRVYTPQIKDASSGPVPAILAYHGGGWIHGHSSLEDDVFKFVASETLSVVFGVDYRLAPEHPFPAPHDDSYKALNYVVDNAAKYNVDTKRIALWGCSAGGNLVAGVALRDAREHEVTRICHASLLVPALCPPKVAPAILSVPTSAYSHFGSTGNPFLLSKADETWEIFANGTENLTNQYLAPLLATPEKNHCPMYVVAAAVDVLRDEAVAYSMAYRDAGIDVQLEIVAGAPHGMLAATEAAVSKQYWRNQVRVFNTALHTTF